MKINPINNIAIGEFHEIFFDENYLRFKKIWKIWMSVTGGVKENGGKERERERQKYKNK